MAQIFEHLACMGYGRPAIGVNRRADKGRFAETDPQTFRRVSNGGKLSLAERWRDIRRPSIWTLAGIHHRGSVAHAAGQEAVNCHARPAFAHKGAVREAGPRGFETEQPAAGGGYAYRPASI